MTTTTTPQPLSPNDERTFSILAHAVQLANFVTGLGGLVGVLVVWLLMRERSRVVEAHGREALNFQITLLIAAAVGMATTVILVGFLILAACAIAGLVFPIIGAMKAADGQSYRYPVAIRLIPAPAEPPPVPPGP